MYIVPRYNKALKFGICDTCMTILHYQFIYNFDQNEAIPEICKILVDTAVNNGGKDDATVVMIEV